MEKLTQTTERDGTSPSPAPDAAKHGLLEQAVAIEGALAVALVDRRSGRCVRTAGKSASLRLGAFALSAARMLATYAEMEEQIGISFDVEDVVITLQEQYHLVRKAQNRRLFLYAAFDRGTTNLALARAQMGQIAEMTD